MEQIFYLSIIILIFIIFIYTSTSINANIGKKQNTNTRLDESHDRNVYAYIDGIYKCIGSSKDFTENEKDQSIRNIDGSSPLIQPGDVFFETQDHLYNYAGHISELKVTKCSNKSKHYYVITPHKKKNSEITYYVLYPY